MYNWYMTHNFSMKMKEQIETKGVQRIKKVRVDGDRCLSVLLHVFFLSGAVCLQDL